MTKSFNEYSLADAVIKQVLVDGSDARISIVDWKEEPDVLVFSDVIGLEAYSPINESISRGVELTEDPLLDRACKTTQELVSDFKCYSLYSSWSDEPILKIVARSFTPDGKQL